MKLQKLKDEAREEFEEKKCNCSCHTDSETHMSAYERNACYIYGCKCGANKPMEQPKKFNSMNITKLKIGDKVKFGFDIAVIVDETESDYILCKRIVVGEGWEIIKYKKEGMPELLLI